MDPCPLGFSSDGAIWAIKTGRARRYLGDGVWVVDRKVMPFSALSAGSAANVYGISGGKLYAFISHAVQQVDPGKSIASVSVAPGDGTVWGLDFQQNAYFYDGKNWTDPPAGTPPMTQISVVEKDNVIGTKSGGAALQRFDGQHWSEMSLSSPLEAAGCKTYFACAVKGHRKKVHLFTIDEWKDKSTAIVNRAMFWRVLDADTWQEQSRTQLPGMMMKMSVAFDISAVIDDSGRNISLWGWNDDAGTYNGSYRYDFIAGTWNFVGDYAFPAAVPGGGFVIQGYGSGGENVLRTEIKNMWSSIPMPFRSTVNDVSARNESEFYAASSDGECYHWIGLGWFPVTQPVTQPQGISLVSVSVAEDGSLWVVDSAGVVWERVEGSWKSHGGTFSVVSASSGGHAYAWQNDGNKLYRMSAEDANWTQLSLPASGVQAYGASSDDTCTVAAGTSLYLYDPPSGTWTLRKNTDVTFWDMSVQDEYHIFALSSVGYWMDSEAPPTEVAEQAWEGTDFSGDEWADWLGIVP
jgi:hypothetical protein